MVWRRFYDWINNSLADADLARIDAFSFNLFEEPGSFGIEVIGAPEFREHDPDWACDESFRAPNNLSLPIEISGRDWESCLERMVSLLKSYLESGEPGAMKLKATLAVGIGFVDGELRIAWKARSQT